MHSLPQTASDVLPALVGASPRSRRAEDLAYQTLTVAAMILLLAGLWVF